MNLRINTYVPGTSPVHACDARVKILLLIAYSVTLFLVGSWAGLAACALIFAIALKASSIPCRQVFGIVVPVYVLVALTIALNSFSLDASGAQSILGAMPLAGPFCFVPAGFARGCFFALRILLLVFASLVVSFTSTSTELTCALGSFLSPLRRAHVPVDDAVMVFSLALRFIPVTAEEFGRVRDAQWSRGASFGTGSLRKRLRAWQTVFIPLFVGLFRRADVLARAMDARCYGAPAFCCSSLHVRRFDWRSAAVLAAGLAACIAVALLG